MMRSAYLLVGGSVLLQVACASSNFSTANEPSAQDTGSTTSDVGSSNSDAEPPGDAGGSAEVGLPPECLEPRPSLCASPEGSHSPVWSTSIGTQAAPTLSMDSSFAFEMNVLPRARLDKFEVPMAIEGASCDGNVTITVKVETCPGVFVTIRTMDRPASTMKASSNYWWFNQSPPDLPWLKINQRYRFEVTTNSKNCKFRIANLPAGVVREAAAGFAWFMRTSDTPWTKQSGDVVAVPWILRCLGG